MEENHEIEEEYNKKGGESMAQDPVCNMNVEESKAGATSIYKGETYYFCSANCKENFEKEPEKYIKDTGGHEHSPHYH